MRVSERVQRRTAREGGHAAISTSHWSHLLRSRPSVRPEEEEEERAAAAEETVAGAAARQSFTGVECRRV